jgi:hypothetical protein
VVRRSEAAHAALRRRQLVDLDEVDLRHRQHDELRDAHARLDDEGLPPVGVDEIDEHLAAIAGVDESRCVDDRDAVLRREPRARLDEAGKALGDRDGEARRDERSLTRRELDPLARREIEACVAVVCPRRDLGFRPQPTDVELDQALSRCDRDSAIR